MDPTTGSAKRSFFAAFVLTTIAASFFALPMLALMLVPELMSSREGSESFLAIGTTLYLALVVLLVVFTPAISGIVAPTPLGWTWKRALGTANTLRKTMPRAFWLRVAEFIGVFVLAQVVGMLYAEANPYLYMVREYAQEGESIYWEINYPNYYRQALLVYGITCVGAGWYGTRLRALAEAIDKVRGARTP